MGGARSQVAVALQQLSQALGCRLELDHNRTLVLEFEGGESCMIEAPSWANLVYLFAPVLHIEAGSRAAMLEWALAANLIEIDLPGVFFALDRASDGLFLCCRIAGEDLDAEQLSRLITTLIEEARALRQRAGAL
jgi:hypothetical protein